MPGTQRNRQLPIQMIIEHPIDDTLQTGDSRLLGGGMSIHAPWKRD
jgi:hypothetical protein